ARAPAGPQTRSRPARDQASASPTTRGRQRATRRPPTGPGLRWPPRYNPYSPAPILPPPLRVNPRLALLQPYPFERLRALFAGSVPDSSKGAINLSIGEPKHATP